MLVRADLQLKSSAAGPPGIEVQAAALRSRRWIGQGLQIRITAGVWSMLPGAGLRLGGGWGAMSYTLLRGSFVIRYPDLPRQGPEPDGDTVKFRPDTPALVEALP